MQLPVIRQLDGFDVTRMPAKLRAPQTSAFLKVQDDPPVSLTMCCEAVSVAGSHVTLRPSKVHQVGFVSQSSPLTTGRSPAAARTTIGLAAVPALSDTATCSTYVPPCTTRVSPGSSELRALPIVRQGADSVPAFESDPVGDTARTLPAAVVVPIVASASDTSMAVTTRRTRRETGEVERARGVRARALEGAEGVIRSEASKGSLGPSSG